MRFVRINNQIINVNQILKVVEKENGDVIINSYTDSYEEYGKESLIVEHIAIKKSSDDYHRLLNALEIL